MSDALGPVSSAADIWGADRVYPDGSFMFHCHLFGYLDLAARLQPGARVLDLACGEGYGSAVLAEHVTCVGLDLEGGLLAASATRYPGPGFVAGDALRLPFEDATFDAVAALQVIEHLPEEATDAFVAEMARVVRDDGFAYIATPNIDRLPRTATKEFNPHHFRDFTPASLQEVLSRSFADVELYGQMLDDSLPRARQLLDAAQKEWGLMPTVEKVEVMIHWMPGPVRVRMRRLMHWAAGIKEWPLPEAESAREEIGAEDFRLAQPAEDSGNTIAIARSPRRG